MNTRPMLYVVGSVAREVDVLKDAIQPVTQPAQVTQDQLVEVLTLERELERIRRRIIVKRLKIASALMAGATVEAGRHEAVFNPKRKGLACVEISSFTGGILNPHALEEFPEKCQLRPSFAG